MPLNLVLRYAIERNFRELQVLQGVANNSVLPRTTRYYSEFSRGYSEFSRGYSEFSRGYDETTRGYTKALRYNQVLRMQVPEGTRTTCTAVHVLSST